MIREILLLHHTHTDIGYTHPQPIVFELHHRFIESALDLADATARDPEERRFRWTCEVTGTTRAWWNQASNADRDRFLGAVARRQFEVAAMEWHLTPLADLRMLVRSMENVRFFRDLGIPVRSAMNTDVNGVPWGLVDVLLDHDVTGFSMAINSHMGGPVTPRPGAFRWAGPSGREITVWNGFQYWHVANHLLRVPSSVEAVSSVLPAFLTEVERRGYPLPFLPLQITTPSHPDNAAPDPNLTRFLRDWLATDPDVRIRTVLLSDVFDRLRQEDLPVLTGDWTDYWNFGAGSSARETTVYLEGLRVLDAAHSAAAWPGKPECRERQHLDAAHESLALYAEHTWGADCSVSSPESIEARMQWATKSAYAFRGLAHARIVLRDALDRLADRARGDAPTYLLYNPLSMPIKGKLKLPVENLDWALTPAVHHAHRLDGALGNAPEASRRWIDFEIPAFGYRTYPISALPYSTSERLLQSEHGISSSRVRLEFSSFGGVNRLEVDGVNYCGAGETFTFGVPILERPAGGSRREIMDLDFNQLEPADGWHTDWERASTPGTLISSEGSSTPGAVEFTQTFSMENGDTVAVLYRLFEDDPTVDVEVLLTSAGDAKPYSLALPFTLPESGLPAWHFDTAGAIVEFDKEQLPDAARHYVTCRRFVRMQTSTAALTIATPDLPLWKFGGLFFAPTRELKAEDRGPVTLAWLSNNYWEVNFLGNQTGETRYRLRLCPHAPEAVADSYIRSQPFAVPPRVHAYRAKSPSRSPEAGLVRIDREGAVVDFVRMEGEDMLLSLQNLSEEPSDCLIYADEGEWSSASHARLDGKPLAALDRDASGAWKLQVPARGLCAVRLAR